MSKHKSTEYENFDRTMRVLINVPHSEIKAKLEAEKAAKEKKPRQQKVKMPTLAREHE